MPHNTRLVTSKFINGANILVEKKLGFTHCSLHGHDFYEIDIIIGGSATTTLNNKPKIAKTGTIFFLSPEDFHNYSSDDKLDIYNIQFTEDVVSSAILERIADSKNRIYTPDEKCFQAITILTMTMENIHTDDPANIEILSKLLECILLLLCRNLTSEKNPNPANSDMQKAVIYLHAHFRENPSLGDVAGVLHLNEKYFCRKFREYTGQKYKDYLKAMKLRYARRLILVTSRTISEISSESGYGSQSHFNREFKEYYGMAPLELRRQARETP